MEQFQFLGLMIWMKKRGNKMEKSFRLSSDGMFSRPEEIFPEMPLRIIFLSVEGNVTEQNRIILAGLKNTGKNLG